MARRQVALSSTLWQPDVDLWCLFLTCVPSSIFIVLYDTSSFLSLAIFGFVDFQQKPASSIARMHHFPFQGKGIRVPLASIARILTLHGSQKWSGRTRQAFEASFCIFCPESACFHSLVFRAAPWSTAVNKFNGTAVRFEVTMQTTLLYIR